MAKTVAVELDKVRNIKFGINGLIKLEEVLNKPLTSLGNGDFGISDIRAMLFVGLSWEDKDLTLEKVGDLMDECMETKGLEYLMEHVGQALNASLGGNALPSDK